jgi:hypothetical protein
VSVCFRAKLYQSVTGLYQSVAGLYLSVDSLDCISVSGTVGLLVSPRGARGGGSELESLRSPRVPQLLLANIPGAYTSTLLRTHTTRRAVGRSRMS